MPKTKNNQKFPLSEEIVSEFLNLKLMHPKGFLSRYEGEEKDFLDIHAREGKVLENFWEKTFPLRFTKPFVPRDELETRIMLAKNAYNSGFLFYTFSYLAEMTEESVKKQIENNYYHTCSNIQELRSCVLDKIVPMMETNKDFGSSQDYNYSMIIPLEKINFDRESALRTIVKLGEIIIKRKPSQRYI